MFFYVNAWLCTIFNQFSSLIFCLLDISHLLSLNPLSYYNNIESLDELKRLKHNPNLKELDLRLNPVTRTETDYRLYLIHMLPNLQKLDDRSVRDRERQGALIHFSSSQATEMTVHPRREEPPSRPPNPRAEHVKNLGNGRGIEAMNPRVHSELGFVCKWSLIPPILVLDDDDVEILDLIARTGGDLSRPRPLTGSDTNQPDMEDYSLHAPKPGPSPSVNDEVDEVLAAYKRKYPNIPDVKVTDEDERPRQSRRQDPNLEFADEADAYNKFKSHGYFTPNPTGEGEDSVSNLAEAEREGVYPAPPTRVQLERTVGPAYPEEDLDTNPAPNRRSYSVPPERLNYGDDSEGPVVERTRDLSSERPKARTAEDAAPTRGRQPGRVENPESRLFLFQILDLVDRYWNGSKSLHKNNKFKTLAYGAIDDYLKTLVDDSKRVEIQQLRAELGQIRKENGRLRRNEDLTKSSLEDTAATEAHLKASLQKAFTDVLCAWLSLQEMLKDKLQTCAMDNKRLQQKLQQHESFSNSQSVSQPHLDNLQAQNEQLKREIERQAIQLKQLKQLQELSHMLQESHKSLVQTNDHLLKDLDETRERHQHEVTQLNWSYNQLKKTVGGASLHEGSSQPPRGGVANKGEGNASVVIRIGNECIHFIVGLFSSVVNECINKIACLFGRVGNECIHIIVGLFSNVGNKCIHIIACLFSRIGNECIHFIVGLFSSVVNECINKIACLFGRVGNECIHIIVGLFSNMFGLFFSLLFLQELKYRGEVLFPIAVVCHDAVHLMGHGAQGRWRFSGDATSAGEPATSAPVEKHRIIFGDIIHDERVAFLEQIFGHMTAHVPQPDKPNFSSLHPTQKIINM
ncbi:CEP72-like protein, partial [Mya arenaria]